MCGGGGREVKAEKILGKGKKLWERSTTEAEKEENIWRREIFLPGGRKNREGKRRKDLVKGNIFWLRKNGEGKGGKKFGKENIF